ncbi:MAG TPA: hypothetical protein VKB86_17565 [Pyrinomonadaceae bacterium]|nr:hypothetical protein [Pyrinomonadaceae bacterium]
MKVLACCYLLLALTALCLAQEDKSKTHPDFSGTWMSDETLTSRANPKQLVRNTEQTTLVILHREPEVKITIKTISGGNEQKREVVYYSDGRGETNPGPTISLNLNGVSKEIKSITEWKKGKLLTTSVIRTPMRGAFYNVYIFEEWKLSSDGQILTQTTSANSDTVYGVPIISIPLGGEIKRVYRRVSN